jgi:hypothetical protein
MAEQSYPQFSADSINQALEAARTHSESLSALTVNHETPLAESALKISAQCISVKVQNRKVCINLPFGIGSKCLPIPGWVPNGTAVEACLHICTKWGIPCGVEVTVSAAGKVIVKQGFGCSC